MKAKLFQIGIIAAAAVCVVLFFVVVVRFNTISLSDIPPSFIGAAMGALITGVITLVLLRGQTSAEEVKERNVKVFEMKKDVFQKYIDKVWDNWNDQHISDVEFTGLYEDFYKKVSLHLAKKKSDKIADALIEIGKIATGDDEAKPGTLKDKVFDIIDTLVEDLGMGGKINRKKHVDLQKAVFPGLFRKALEREISTALRSVYTGFLPGKYEDLGYGQEWLSFCFPVEAHLGYGYRNDQAKIIVGPFKNNADVDPGWGGPGLIRVGLFLDIPIEKLQSDIYHYKVTDKNFGRRIITLHECDELGLIPIDKPLCKAFFNGEDDEEDKGDEFCLNFGAPDELREKYQGNYTDVAKSIAHRAAKVVQIGKPTRYDGAGDLSIVDFLVKQGVI